MATDACPSDPEHTADLYVVGHLSDPEAEAFEVHLLLCDTCRKEVLTADEFRAAIRHAAGATLPPQKRG